MLLMPFVACNTLQTVKNSPSSNSNAYYESVIDAMAPDSSAVSENLLVINKENKKLTWKTINGEDYLLVVSWTNAKKYYEPFIDSLYYNSGSYFIWITAAPELLLRMSVENYQDPQLRLEQLIGLPPNSGCRYFVEFWVKPSDIFRPCPDQEINDSKCDLCFPSFADSTHIKWINEQRINLYYSCDIYDKYPWTQLGYTYDWNPQNKNHVGLSEFVVKENSKIVVNAIYTTDEYLKKSTSNE
jgi:hypothetical protein